MKKTIYILILICVLTLLPSCGESGEPQENRPGFSEKDSEAEAANSMDKPQFAAEEPDEVGVSEITEDTFAAPEYNIQDGAVRALAVIAILSVYLFSPALLCNYAMPIRTELFMSNGVNVDTGYIYAVSFDFFLILLGAIIFRSYDLINRD